MAQRFSINPDPPTQGQQATVCYDFAGLTDTSVQVTLDWYPDPDSAEVIQRPDPPATKGCVTITVPGNAETLILTDPSGGSEDFSTSVTPAP